jgi:hypothetical protein
MEIKLEQLALLGLIVDQVHVYVLLKLSIYQYYYLVNMI